MESHNVIKTRCEIDRVFRTRYLREKKRLSYMGGHPYPMNKFLQTPYLSRSLSHSNHPLLLSLPPLHPHRSYYAPRFSVFLIAYSPHVPLVTNFLVISTHFRFDKTDAYVDTLFISLQPPSNSSSVTTDLFFSLTFHFNTVFFAFIPLT